MVEHQGAAWGQKGQAVDRFLSHKWEMRRLGSQGPDGSCGPEALQV